MMTNLDKYFNVVIQKSKQERGIREMEPLSEPIGRETIGYDTPWYVDVLFYIALFINPALLMFFMVLSKLGE